MRKSILLSLMFVGILSAECVRDNTKEVVVCSDTNLMWQDNNDVLNEYWKTWEDAVKYCENGLNGNGTYAGFNDWRLPNIRELNSITERTKKHHPSIKDGFAKVISYGYWSSTTTLHDTEGAFYVGFYHGSVNRDFNKHEKHSVRCVRDN